MFEHGYAVVIAVDKNQVADWALPTVAKDVDAVYEVLVHPERCAYNPENVKRLKGEESTGRNITDALEWLNEQVKADPDATAVIYYSGHGMVDPNTGQYYLIPYDIKSKDRVLAYAIRAETFNALIADIEARRLLAILDCCHAAGMEVKNIDFGGAESKTFQRAPFPTDLPETKGIPEYKGAPGMKAVSDLLEGQGRAILNSSTGVQYSWTRADGQMSLFTYHLIESLTGHAPHADDDTVVYVTDVMSWVTRQVKKSAAAIGVEQTPIMKTSGVFPVAQLIGGQGVALSKGIAAPDPLAPLPKGGNTTTFHQEGYQVEKQYNIGSVEGGIAHLGDNINNYGDTIQGHKIDTGGGDYVGGDKIGGDQIHGDQIHGDKFEGISVSGVQGSSISFGRGSQATTTNQGQSDGDNLNVLFAPLYGLVAQENPTLSRKVTTLKEQVTLGSRADDDTISGLIRELVEGVPAAKSELASLFKHPGVAKSAGKNTKFIIGLFG